MFYSTIKHHRSTIVAMAGLAAAGAIAAAFVGVPALATPPGGGFSGTLEFLGNFAPFDIKADKAGKWDLTLRSKGRTDVIVFTVLFPAGGGTSGWHSHPGPNLLTVTAGSVVVYDSRDAGCPGRTFAAGDTFYDNGGSGAHLVRNDNAINATIKAIAFYPEGIPPANRRIDRDKPAGCTVAG